MAKPLAAALAVVIAVALAATAPAQTDSRQTVRAKFTTKRTNASTGVRSFVDYRDPRDSDGKPPIVRRIATTFPRGTEFNARVVRACRASNDELRREGRDACPRGSRIGSGAGSAKVTDTLSVEFDVTVFNTGRGIILLATRRGTDQTVGVSRGTLRGRTLTIRTEPQPGVPAQFQPALDRIRFATRARSRRGRRYVETPGRCPRSRRWTFLVRFRYTDGVRQTRRATTPCVRRAERRVPRVTG